MRRNFGAALAGMAAFTRAAVANSIVDTTLPKSAKLELSVESGDNVATLPDPGEVNFSAPPIGTGDL